MVSYEWFGFCFCLMVMRAKGLNIQVLVWKGIFNCRAQENVQICNLTNPAQLFHVFRRQMKRTFKKPLIIMSPKSLLRHPKVTTNMNQLATGQFQEVLDDADLKNKKKVKRVILLSGKALLRH